MNLERRIRFDVRSLEEYFRRLFHVLHTATPRLPPDTPKRYMSHDYRAFVRPDMIANTYQLLDFWLSELCDAHQARLGLQLSRRDIRGANELDARHKYLTKVALLDLSAVEHDLDHLHALRRVRNTCVHSGGHANEADVPALAKTSGITLDGSLVVISDQFVRDSLRHVYSYLVAVAKLASPAKLT